MTFRTMIIVLAVGACLASALPSAAQTPPPPLPTPAAGQDLDGGTPAWIRPETPAQRRDRLGMNEDPGINPDPSKVWFRFGHNLHIVRYDRQYAAYDSEPGRVRPRMDLNFAFEIYQQNEKWVWIWEPTMEEIRAAQEAAAVTAVQRSVLYTEPQMAYLRKAAPEFSELNPPSSRKVIRFEESSGGLPTTGSWRTNAAFADMNGDGHVDIIVPPVRSGGTLPAIFLGDGKGGWKAWNTEWPYEISYGGVAVADFNGDKKLDLVFGVHLVGLRVFLGDGKGKFIDSSSNLLPIAFPTRRVMAMDVNGDSKPDVVALGEGPTPGGSAEGAKLRAYLNRNSGASWEPADISLPAQYVGGDWLASGNFNGDQYPDFVASNVYFQRPETLYTSGGRGKWNVVDWQDGVLVPYLSTYTAVAAGRFGSKRLDDAIVSFQRSWPTDMPSVMIAEPPLKGVTGIDRISFAGKTPVRTSIIRWGGERPVSGLAAADIDNDGKNDLLFTRFTPRQAVLLLGDGKGGFSKAAVEGVNLTDNPNYDVHVVDVNGDKRLDLVVMYESTEDSPFRQSNGRIQVFLNRGETKAQPKEAAGT